MSCNERRRDIYPSVWGALGDFFERVGETLVRVLYRLAAWTIIPFIEGLMRIWFHLDPRVYFARSRIRRITEGYQDLKSNKYVIFTLYMKGPLPVFTANIFDVIEQSSFNLVVVSNAELDSFLRAQILERCHLLIERANLGRDFGAYRDAISTILRRARNIDRLILVNDSLFFMEKGLSKLVSDLDGPQEFIGVTEVFQDHYHVQSFMLSFGPGVIRSRQFRKFWQKYRPISTRRWSIHKGEVRPNPQVDQSRVPSSCAISGCSINPTPTVSLRPGSARVRSSSS